MIHRNIIEKIRVMADKMPVISITGPRQSGKTTVAKMCFPDYDYVNIENPDTLEEAKADPRSFLTNFKQGLIIDEIQNFPELFSYIQTISDSRQRVGEYILTGSQNFLLSEKITQSLAGRAFITHLLPFNISELQVANLLPNDEDHCIFKGFYPRIYDRNVEPQMFYPSYIQTYAERDIRQTVNVSNLFLFQKLMRLAAGRIGQLLNYTNIANELGVDLKTVQSWFSILNTSFVVFFLQPHHQNFTKRLVKTPKLYFYDTGLACSLLGIKRQEDLEAHWARGALFENMVIADLMKNYFNRAEIPPLYFWRDNTGNEIDCLIDECDLIKIIEIKSSKTISTDFFKRLNFYRKLNRDTKSYLIYGGDRETIRNEIEIYNWKNASKISHM